MIAVLLIVLSILPPLAIWWLSPFLRSLDGVQSQFMNIIGVLFGLNLVFVCNEIWQSREAATLAMSREAEALRNIGRIASNMPEQAGAPVFVAARQYVETAIANDFPKGTPLVVFGPAPALDKTSLLEVINLSDVILDRRTLEKLDPAIKSLLIAELTAVRDNRLERIALLTLRPNRVKWFSLIFLEVMTLLSIAVVHVMNKRAILVACLLYFCTVNPFLLTLYSSQWPFSGLDPLHPIALEAALDRLNSMEAAYKH